LRANGALDRLCDNIPSPNGITLSTTEQHCYVGVTRLQQIWRLPLMADGSVSKTGVAIQLSGGRRADRQTLYITEALSGDILMARLPVTGKLMYGLQ
jgi:hypothetical protein